MKKTILPISEIKDFEEGLLFIWYGVSRAYRFVNGEYERDESYDYIFSVRQLRQGNTWKSIKTLHRTHKDYDFKAGERDQTMYFEISFKKNQNDIISELNTSLGNGNGKTDSEFRNQSLEINFDEGNGIIGSLFIPYNKIKITQTYKYEYGQLIETVELFKEKDGKKIPFMKNEEIANMYVKGKFDEAPTIFL